MATNLRLRPETEAALRAEAERTGRSQQQIIRDALDEYLNIPSPNRTPGARRGGSRRLDLIPARVPYRRPHRLLELPEGVTSIDLLDREDRI